MLQKGDVFMYEDIYLSLPANFILKTLEKNQVDNHKLRKLFQTFDTESLYDLKENLEIIKNDFYKSKIICAIADAKDQMYQELMDKYKIYITTLEKVEQLYRIIHNEVNYSNLILKLRNLSGIQLCILLELCVLKDDRNFYDLLMNVENYSSTQLANQIISYYNGGNSDFLTMTCKQIVAAKENLLKRTDEDYEDILKLVDFFLRIGENQIPEEQIEKYNLFLKNYSQKEQIWQNNVKNKVLTKI